MDVADNAGERYRAFIENSREGIWRFDTEEPIPTSLPENEQIARMFQGGFLAEANDAFAQMYGYERGEQIAGTRLEDLLLPGKPENIAYLRAFIQGGYRLTDAVSVEPDRDGRLRHFSNTFIGIVENGKLIRAWGTQRDITLQAEAQARLHESLELLSTIAHGTADAVFVKDAEGRYLFANEAVAQAIGKPVSEILGRFDPDILPPETARAVRANDLTVMQTGESITTEEAVVGADGETRYFIATKSPKREPDGTVAGIIAVTRDVTEIRRAERGRVESEARIRALYELTSRSDLDFGEKVQHLLRAGRDWLGLATGVLARTDCDRGEYEIVQMDAAGETFPEGTLLPLENTFCSELVRSGAEAPPLAVTHAGSDARWRGHSAYRAFGTETYLGAVVQVNGLPWGALAFADALPRGHGFTAFDKQLVRLMAQWIGGEIARREAEAALRAGIERQRRFLRDVVKSMTEGRLRLCFSEADLPAPFQAASDRVALSIPTLHLLRRSLNKVTDRLQLDDERAMDVETAVGEAAMNAVIHGGGGEGWVCADDERCVVQVWVRDRGRGIEEDALPRMLEKGVSTAGTLGHGFWLMLKTCDRVYLLTGPTGTTVVLEQEKAAPEPAWLQSVTL